MELGESSILIPPMKCHPGHLARNALFADLRSARGDGRPTEAIRDSDGLAETIVSLKPPAVAEEHDAGS